MSSSPAGSAAPSAGPQLRTPGTTGRVRVGFWLVAGVYALAMLGGTLPIPLYVFWAPEFGFGPFTTTLVFATYALGTVLALVVFGSLSDRAGRRPLLAVALVVAAASTTLFLLARDVELLLAARFLSGLATGVVTATATAALGELDATHDDGNRTSIVSTAANMGGLGLGAIVAGLFAQLAPHPTHLVFWVYLLALVPALVAVAIVPETVPGEHRASLTLRRPTLPDAAGRTEFLRAATAVFAAFAVSGLFSSLVPSFLREQLHVQDLAVIGGEIGLLFIVALLAQLAVPDRWLSRWWLAPTLLAGGVVVFETGLWTRSLPVFVAGTLLAGAGIGLAFRRGITSTQRLADPARRADLIATYFLAAYAGTIIPTLTLGLLVQVIDRDVSTLILAVAVVALTAVGARPDPADPADPADRLDSADSPADPDRPTVSPRTSTSTRSQGPS